MIDVYLRSVPSDASQRDVRLYNPANPDSGSTVDCTVASSQAQSAEATLERAVSSIAESSQAQSTDATLSRTLDAIGSAYQAQSSTGVFGLTLDSIIVSGQAQTVSGVIGSLVVVSNIAKGHSRPVGGKYAQITGGAYWSNGNFKWPPYQPRKSR